MFLIDSSDLRKMDAMQSDTPDAWDAAAPDNPETSHSAVHVPSQRLTVKNTFLHIVDRDDPQQDPRVMTRIYSAPTPECNFSRKLRPDEPMKVTRISEQWDVSSCVLEEADGSSVSWSARTKSGTLLIALAEDISTPTMEPMTFGQCPMEDQEEARVGHAGAGKEPMPPTDSLSMIQEMFSNMSLAQNHDLLMKNSLLRVADDEQDRIMQKYSSSPDSVDLRRMPSHLQPAPSLSATRGTNDIEESTQSSRPPDIHRWITPEPPHVLPVSRPEEDAAATMGVDVEAIGIPRPWEPDTKVAIPTKYNKARPPPGSKFLCTFVIGIRECSQFAVSRRIIGRAGYNMKFISTLCPRTKLRLRGKGSGFRERDTNAESDVSLRINVSSPYSEEYELAKRELSSLLSAIYCDYKKMFGKDVRLKIIEHPKNPKE